MSRGWKEGSESSCGLGAKPTVAACAAAPTDVVRTDGPWMQQGQQEGGQHSGEDPQRQSEHESARAAMGSRNAKAASRAAKRRAGRRIIGGILHEKRLPRYSGTCVRPNCVDSRAKAP